MKVLIFEIDKMSKRFRPARSNPVQYESEDEVEGGVGKSVVKRKVTSRRKDDNEVEEVASVGDRVAEGHALLSSLMNSSLSSSTVTEYKVLSIFIIIL